MYYLGIDIGGTWIKGALVHESHFEEDKQDSFLVKRIKSPLHKQVSPEEFIKALQELIQKFETSSSKIAGIGISTAGIVNYHGTKVTKAAEHLNVLKTDTWKTELERKLNCTVTIINDADAATIGLAELGYLKGNKTIGVMPIGTGLGFAVWRNGRRWRPGKSLTLLGSIRTPNGSYDSISSASIFAANDVDKDLISVLTNAAFSIERDNYLQSTVNIINSAAILYKINEVIICGGLSDAAHDCAYPLENQLNTLLEIIPPELDIPVKVRVAKEGNKLQLIGALAIAKGEAIATENRIENQYCSFRTEVPQNKNLHLEKMKTSEILETFWEAEQEAGQWLKESLPIISEVVDESAERLKHGGRIIYVGAGTSGRIAAMDAVEIPCTYGFPEDRIITLIPGGIADASIEIEDDFEEDASAIPEMLLLNIQKNDVIIGISASGSAYYVQSALAFAKSKSAFTVMIQVNQPETELPFCDTIILLNSGNEVVAGSTRMKAGTATKKVLNFLSSTIMIKLGKVVGSYMVDVACINKKLIERAQSILEILYKMDKEEALKQLKMTDMDLSVVIKHLQNRVK